MIVEILRTKGIRGVFHSFTAESRKKQLQKIFEENEDTLMAAIDPWQFKISINKDVPTYFWFENESDTYKEKMFARQKAPDTITINFSRTFRDEERFQHDSNDYAIDITAEGAINFRCREHSKTIYVNPDQGLLPVGFPNDSKERILLKKISILREINKRLKHS